MTVRTVTPILNVSSVTESMAWFMKLGWSHGFVWPHGDLHPNFGSVCSDKAEVFLCLGAQGSRGTTMPSAPGDDHTDGVWMSWWLDAPADVDALHATALSHGMIVTMAPEDKPWHVREFHLRHPDGHMFRVSAPVGED